MKVGACWFYVVLIFCSSSDDLSCVQSYKRGPRITSDVDEAISDLADSAKDVLRKMQKRNRYICRNIVRFFC